MSNKLMEQIDALVAEKTFSLDAVNAITAMRSAVKELQETVDYLQKQWDAERKENDRLNAAHRDQLEQINDARSAQKEAEKLADAYRQQGIEGKCAVAELKGYAAALNTIFKPSAVRETVHKSVPLPVVNGTYTSVQTYPEATATERSAE